MSSTISQFEKYSNDMLRLQKNIDKIPNKIEGKIDNYNELSNTQIKQLLDVRKLLKNIDVDLSNRVLIGGRLEIMDQSISSIIDIAISMKKDLTLKNSAASKNFSITQIAKANLANVQNKLNTKFEGRYLFSGSKTSSPAVDLTKNNIINNVATSNYYQGDNYIFYMQLENIQISYGITATDPAFINLIASLNYASQIDSNSANLQIAANLLDDSINQMIQLRAAIGDNLVINEQYQSQNMDMKSFLKEKEVEINPADPVQAMIDLQSDRAALEALYRSYAITSRLNIMDYL